MIRITAGSYIDQRLALALVESDRRYFEMGARTSQLPLGLLCWMPGLNDLAASCVVHRIVSEFGADSFERWLAQIETELRARCIPRIRLYLDDSSPEIEDVFYRYGLETRSELGFLAPQGYPEPPGNIQLRQVQTSADWKRKQDLHSQAIEGPDGYTNQAALWVEMERRKCATGNMKCYLVYRDKQVVGAVGTIAEGGLLRLKNIVVDPRLRRQGIALAVVQHLWRMAEADYGCRLGVFGVAGGKGSKLYRRAGLYSVTVQYEWSKILVER